MGGIETLAAAAIPALTSAASSAVPAVGNALGGTLSALLPAGATTAATNLLPNLTSFLNPPQFSTDLLNEILTAGAPTALPDLSQVAFSAVPNASPAFSAGQGVGNSLLGLGKDVAKGAAEQGLMSLIAPQKRQQAPPPQIDLQMQPAAQFTGFDFGDADMTARLMAALNRYS